MQRLAVVAICGALGAAGLAGCETTQEKAAAQQAESARILKARAKRHHGPKSETPHADGTKRPPENDNTARRQRGVDKTARQEKEKG